MNWASLSSPRHTYHQLVYYITLRYKPFSFIHHYLYLFLFGHKADGHAAVYIISIRLA